MISFYFMLMFSSFWFLWLYCMFWFVQLSGPHGLFSPSGSSVHGIFQAVILEWVAISCSRVSSPPMDWVRTSCVFCFACGFFALFITASLGVGLFGLIVFETPCASCVWISVSFFRFGKFSAIIHSHTFQSPFLLLLESLLCVDWHTLCYHTLLSFFFHLTFNLFFFWLDNFHYSV